MNILKKRHRNWNLYQLLQGGVFPSARFFYSLMENADGREVSSVLDLCFRRKNVEDYFDKKELVESGTKGYLSLIAKIFASSIFFPSQTVTDTLALVLPFYGLCFARINILLLAMSTDSQTKH